MNIKAKLGDSFWRFRSSKLRKKVVVIESDDWGSFRTESKQQLKELNKLGSNIQEDPYIQIDGIADTNDLEALFEVLTGVKDFKGNYACLTANTCVANPDFDKIRESRFSNFFYETFDQSILRKKNGHEILKLWDSGQEHNIFFPQLHGREHVHALAWLAELREGNKDLLHAFESRAWGIPYQSLFRQRRKNLQASLDTYNLPEEEDFQSKWVSDSAKIFKKYFGFNSKSFIAPAYVWNSRLNSTFEESGIQSLQGLKLQYQPNKDSYKRKMRFMGEKDSKCKLQYFPRNVFFEPALFPDKDWYSETLKGVEKAFFNKQPAIIGSHRINYIGKLDERNRFLNLKTLSKILETIVTSYPDVEFISSDRLIDEFYA